MTMPMPGARSGPTAKLAGFTRRLGIQAAMSAIVMAGLQTASVNGYDLRDLLPGAAETASTRTAAVGTEGPAPHTPGIPAPFDIPAEAGRGLDQLLPAGRTAEAKADTAPAPAARVPAEAPLLAALPDDARIAVPTPRPRPAQTRTSAPASEPVAYRAVEPAVALASRPEDLPFDVSSGEAEVEIYELAELADEVPVPPEVDRFTVAGIVPSGSALLRGTAAVTSTAASTAAHIVTGTASRLVDFVR